ncbi:MAG: hypothetical protein GY884_12470 [Proteobacteria bacterium]|nr:hypothetical protein [Pseudomonadota bacterium]
MFEIISVVSSLLVVAVSTALVWAVASGLIPKKAVLAAVLLPVLLCTGAVGWLVWDVEDDTGERVPYVGREPTTCTAAASAAWVEHGCADRMAPDWHDACSTSWNSTGSSELDGALHGAKWCLIELEAECPTFVETGWVEAACVAEEMPDPTAHCARNEWGGPRDWIVHGAKSCLAGEVE